jgi:hypothetical protein
LASRSTATVSSLQADPPAGSVTGEPAKAQVPIPEIPVQARLTADANPAIDVTVQVDLALSPGSASSAVGAQVIEKLGVGVGVGVAAGVGAGVAVGFAAGVGAGVAAGLGVGDVVVAPDVAGDALAVDAGNADGAALSATTGVGASDGPGAPCPEGFAVAPLGAGDEGPTPPSLPASVGPGPPPPSQAPIQVSTWSAIDLTEPSASVTCAPEAPIRSTSGDPAARTNTAKSPTAADREPGTKIT